MLEIYTDGASRGNPGKSAIAYVFVESGKVIELHSEKIEDATLKAKNGEKQQDIEIKKIDVFSKALAFILVGVFLMCVLSSLVPSLEITPYWFDVFERFINYLFTN